MRKRWSRLNQKATPRSAPTHTLAHRPLLPSPLGYVNVKVSGGTRVHASTDERRCTCFYRAPHGRHFCNGVKWKTSGKRHYKPGAHLFETSKTLFASKCPIISKKSDKICLKKHGLVGYGTPRTFGPIGLRLLVVMAIGSASPLVNRSSVFWGARGHRPDPSGLYALAGTRLVHFFMAVQVFIHINCTFRKICVTFVSSMKLQMKLISFRRPIVRFIMICDLGYSIKSI